MAVAVPVEELIRELRVVAVVEAPVPCELAHRMRTRNEQSPNMEESPERTVARRNVQHRVTTCRPRRNGN